MAKQLGKENVDAMLRGMSAVQWMEWKAYMAFAPFTEERADIRAASICQWVVNGWIDRKHHPEPLKIEDFQLVFGDTVLPGKEKEIAKQRAKEQRVQTPEEIQRVISDWVLGSNIVIAEAAKRGT